MYIVSILQHLLVARNLPYYIVRALTSSHYMLPSLTSRYITDVMIWGTVGKPCIPLEFAHVKHAPHSHREIHSQGSTLKQWCLVVRTIEESFMEAIHLSQMTQVCQACQNAAASPNLLQSPFPKPTTYYWSQASSSQNIPCKLSNNCVYGFSRCFIGIGYRWIKLWMSVIAECNSTAAHDEAESKGPARIHVVNPDGSSCIGIREDLVTPEIGLVGTAAATDIDRLRDPSVLQDELRALIALREMLTAVERVVVAAEEERFSVSYRVPRKRALRRTAILLVLDFLYFISQYIAAGILIAKDSDLASTFGSEVFITSLVLAVVVFALGCFALRSLKVSVVSLFLLAETASIMFLIRANMLIWLFVFFRLSVILSAGHLRVLLVREMRAHDTLINNRQQRVSHLSSVTQHVDATIALAQSAFRASTTGNHEQAAQFVSELQTELRTFQRDIRSQSLEMAAIMGIPHGSPVSPISPRRATRYVREIQIRPPMAQQRLSVRVL